MALVGLGLPEMLALGAAIGQQDALMVKQSAYKDLVYALAHSNWIALKLMSTRGIHHVKMLTDGQRTDFANTLDFYRLLGGEL